MNGFAKLIFFLIGLLGMIGSAILAGLTYPLNQYVGNLTSYLDKMWIGSTVMVIAVLLFFASFCLFFSSLLAKGKERSLYIQTEIGTIQLTQKMVDQTILLAVKEKNVLKHPEVYTKLNSKKKRVYAQVTGGTLSHKQLPDTGKELQQHIETKLRELLQVDKVKVDIRMEKRTTEKRNKNEARVV